MLECASTGLCRFTFRPLDFYPLPASSVSLTVMGGNGQPVTVCFPWVFVAEMPTLKHFDVTSTQWILNPDVTGSTSGVSCSFQTAPGGLVTVIMHIDSFAQQFNLTVPDFMTDVIWQWDWAVAYSRLQPQRPLQFVRMQPDIQVPFWAFPHPARTQTRPTWRVCTTRWWP